LTPFPVQKLDLEFAIITFTLDSENAAFESAVKQHFGFLAGEHGIQFAGVREVNDGPRDRGVVARYRQAEVRIDIGWSAIEGSLALLIRLDAEGLARNEPYVYLEPFIEFTSDGIVAPVVPQIYPGMSVRRIEATMMLRKELFQNGIGEVLERVASRLREYYSSICGASVETVRQYHKWYQDRGKTS
jgi:hypothetical protein